MPSWEKVRKLMACYLSGMVIPSRKSPPETTRMSSNYMKRPARVVATTRATKANLVGQFGGLARANGPSSCPKQPASNGNYFKHRSLNDYHRRSSIHWRARTVAPPCAATGPGRPSTRAAARPARCWQTDDPARANTPSSACVRSQDHCSTPAMSRPSRRNAAIRR